MSRTDNHRPQRIREADPLDPLGVEYDLPWGPHPPKWFHDHQYFNRVRRDARDVLRAAAKEYRGAGDTDLEPVPEQARGQAIWYWW